VMHDFCDQGPLGDYHRLGWLAHVECESYEFYSSFIRLSCQEYEVVDYGLMEGTE